MKTLLATTTINISGREVQVDLFNVNGHLEWHPSGKDADIMESGGYLDSGHVLEGYNQEIHIYKYNPDDHCSSFEIPSK